MTRLYNLLRTVFIMWNAEVYRKAVSEWIVISGQTILPGASHSYTFGRGHRQDHPVGRRLLLHLPLALRLRL